jgi:HEAT repeat protein
MGVPGLRAEDASDELIQTVIGLVSDKDKDLRAVGLQQIREDAKGEAATRRFAALLPKLTPDGQAGLLRALADRGDKAARPAVVKLLASKDRPAHLAAISALGALGDAGDVPLLVPLLAAADSEENAAVRESLRRLPGQAVGAALVAELKSAPPGLRAALVQVLAARHAVDCAPALLPVALDADAGVREAAMAALGQLAGPELIPGMVQGILRAEPGAEREAAERAVMLVSNRIPTAAKRTAGLMAEFAKLSPEQQTILLPTLGRVGAALPLIRSSLAAGGERGAAALHALCNWPDGSVGPELLELAQSAGSPADRLTALRGLIRVAPLRDKRTDAQRLELLKKAMALATRDEERNRVLTRCSAVRTVDSLRFVAPYMEQPALAQAAAATVVELAHHRELREPNKAEFYPALDTVIRVSHDADIVDRAQRYKKNQTRDTSRMPKPKGEG